MNVTNTVSFEEELVQWADLMCVRLFKDVDLESIEGLLRACPQIDLQPGEKLITPGQRKDAIYILLSGRLRVDLDDVSGRRIALFEPGESVGELSVIDQKPASALVIAEERSRLLVVPQDIFWALVDASPRIARNLLYTLAEPLRKTNSAISESDRLQAQYKRNATVDELTGLHNRRWVEEMLKRQAMRSSMGSQAL